jgi:hypothetical protein
VKKRPAETITGVAGALAALIGPRLLDIDSAAEITALALVLGAIPAVVTWCVERFKDVG